MPARRASGPAGAGGHLDVAPTRRERGARLARPVEESVHRRARGRLGRQQSQVRERRQSGDAPLREQCRRQRVVVVRGERAVERVRRKIGLDDDLPRQLRAAGSDRATWSSSAPRRSVARKSAL